MPKIIVLTFTGNWNHRVLLCTWLEWNILLYTIRHLASYVYLVIGDLHLDLTCNHRLECLWWNWNTKTICTLVVFSCHLSLTALPCRLDPSGCMVIVCCIIHYYSYGLAWPDLFCVGMLSPCSYLVLHSQIVFSSFIFGREEKESGECPL